MLNCASNKSEMSPLSPEEHERLLQLIADDMVLYEYAKTICHPKVGVPDQP